MTLLKDDSPILKQRAKAFDIDNINLNAVTKLYDKMKEVMVDNKGIGLAAPQIGESVRAIIIRSECGEHGRFLINPEIISKSKKTDTKIERCLSYPDLKAAVKRHKEVTIQYYCIFDYKIKKTHFKDLQARCVQHEIDHLNGITLTDYRK